MIKLTILIFLISFVASAQTDSTHLTQGRSELGFNIGPHFGYFKDLGYSVLNYRQNGTTYNLHFTHKIKSKPYLLLGGISFTSGKLRSGASDYFTTPFILGQVSFRFLFKVRSLTRTRLETYVGPGLNSLFQYLQWGDEMDSWSYVMAHGLDVSVHEAFQLTGRSKISASVTLPVFSNLVRPPYNGFNEHIVQNQEKILKIAFEGVPVSLNRYVCLDLKFDYSYLLTRHINFTLGYLMRYQHVPGYNRLTQFQNQITSGIKIRF